MAGGGGGNIRLNRVRHCNLNIYYETENTNQDDEMIVTDMEGNPVLLTYVDISTGHTTLEPGRITDR